MTPKKYALFTASLLFVFMILNLALWHCLVKHTFTQKDLNRLGSFVSTEPLTQNAKYSKHHTEFREYISSGKKESFDLITIGDSFTNGGGAAYYQDYLTSKYGLKVLNLDIYGGLEGLHILVESGLIDELQPKVVIVESVERAVQARLGRKEVNTTPKNAKELITNRIKNVTASSVSLRLFPPVMINANKNFMYNLFYRMIDPEQLSPQVYIAELNERLFTNPGYEHTLLYLHEDLNYMKSSVNANMVNMNLNNAAKILREKNIQLIFFVGVDKYDLYYPYIINHNGRPENNFFPEMREVSPKDYVFIDTMQIFREALERGEQDIYWFGDTHWSWKGIELFCDELVKSFNWLN